MLNGCIYGDRQFGFVTAEHRNRDNVYTVVVGKNGSGKSKLLRGIVLSQVDSSELLGQREYLEVDSVPDVRLSHSPARVIASSTSPFDRFPLGNRNGAGYYHYLGLKGLSSQNLSMGFVGRAIGALVDFVVSSEGGVKNAFNVFGYLGYYEFLGARFAIDVPFKGVQSVLESSTPYKALSDFLNKPAIGLSRYSNRRVKFKDEELDEILSALAEFFHSGRKPRIKLLINGYGVFDEETKQPIDRSCLVLLKFGILGVRDVSLWKKGVGEPFHIRDASSGEQCVLMSLLGIASYIKDDSLVLIDEPEICLHPEWQEKYIELLMESFGGFKGCHFIIATHSPQILSRIGSQNCYVLDLHDYSVIDARDVNNRSADFQLASVFGAPGYKNEYLSREIISALGVLGSGHELPSERLDILRKIIGLQDVIDRDDPVHRLIAILSDALREI